MVAAPSSGAGKTSVTLALLRALSQDGHPVRSVKLGPDYIDPAFHAAATGRPALNLDAWAMDEAMQRAVLAGAGPLVIESAMGLFDGAGLAGTGSAADVAARFDIPILLVMDCARAAQTLPALVEGLVRHRPGLRFHGLVLNNVGSPRHAALLEQAFEGKGLPPIRAMLPRRLGIALPSRHLGLVQAGETALLTQKLNDLAEWLRESCLPDDLTGELEVPAGSLPPMLPRYDRISVARDDAFSFAYPHILEAWAKQGAMIQFFSPLNDAPPPKADFIYLPGGYPELHAGKLAQSMNFMQGLRIAAQDTHIYGECGGFMVLGEVLMDAEGRAHPMAGLLKLTTSFQAPKLSLGYCTLKSAHGPLRGVWRGHEFHYSTQVAADGAPLFTAKDADGHDLAPMGLVNGRVSGSYAHIIAPAAGPAASEGLSSP
ncbi:MAG: cobyrinate a,c-diamide synthase [Pseudomonadota bacterium]